MQTNAAKRSYLPFLRVLIPVFFMLFVASHFFSIDASAAEIYAHEEAAETATAVNYLSRLIIGLSIPVAAIGLASLAFGFFTGNEKQAEEAKERAKKCLVAVVCLMLLTGVMNLGRSIVSGYEWRPDSSGGLEIIEPDKGWGNPTDDNLVDITEEPTPSESAEPTG